MTDTVVIIEPAWPEPDQVALRAMWGEGLSGGQISKEFSGRYSRSAVIGKAHRLGLACRKVVRIKSPQKIAPPPLIGESARADYRRLMAREYQRRAKLRQQDEPAPQPFTPASDTVAEPLHLALVDLQPGQCKWPYGDSPSFTFCARPADGTYCAEHHAMSYRLRTERA